MPTLKQVTLPLLAAIAASFAAPHAAAADALASSAAQYLANATYTQSRQYAPQRAQRRIAAPIQRARWTAPPRGSFLVRDRVWLPSLRWKTDRYSRTVYAVYRGEIWFLDPVTGWAHTVDRYGRVYISDPRYRAVYSYGTVGDWEGDLPYFFAYYAPNDGYYSLPRYSQYIEYYDSPTYSWYDYPRAQDYWWDTYDDYYRAPSYQTNITFVFYDNRHVQYDRHYHRDVYLGGGGRKFVAPPPPVTYGSASVQASFLASEADAALPAVSAVQDYIPPAPVEAVAVLSETPPVQEFAAPALPINAAEAVAESETVVPAAETMERIESETLTKGEEPVSVTGDEIAIAPEPEPQPETAGASADGEADTKPAVDDNNVSEDVAPRDEAPGDSGKGDPMEDEAGDSNGSSPVDESAPMQDDADQLDANEAIDAESEVESADGFDGTSPSAAEAEQFERDAPMDDSGGKIDAGYDDSASASEGESGYEAPAAEEMESEPAYTDPQDADTGAYESEAAAQPAFEEPAYEEPAYQQEAEQERAAEEPAYEEPAYEEPAYEQPAYEQESRQEPAYEEPSYQGAAPQEPAYEEPAQQEEAPAQDEGSEEAYEDDYGSE